MLEITEYVNFVCSHLQEIADSYEVNITSNHISKIGGDDKFTVGNCWQWELRNEKHECVIRE